MVSISPPTRMQLLLISVSLANRIVATWSLYTWTSATRYDSAGGDASTIHTSTVVPCTAMKSANTEFAVVRHPATYF